jgi:putative ABC transport system permease protein
VNRLGAYLQEAFASLWRNRMRSALTMLGMVIGSASIITVFGISKAATSGIAATFASFGQFPVAILVDQSQDYPQRAQIRYRDVATVAARLGSRAAYVMPDWNRTYPVASGTKRGYVTVTVDGDYHTDSLKMKAGRRFDRADLRDAARVADITNDVAKKFFGAQSAVGRDLVINGGRYRVVGVFANVKGSFLNAVAGSSTINIPWTTYHLDMDPGPMDFLIVYPRNPQHADAIGETAVAALQHIHGERAKYTVENTADQLKAFETVLNAIGIGLSAIGGVALLVAGIGIMNIMLVSVTERTREIGIRKSIGATRKDIVAQFLMESVLLSLGGGLMGMTLGFLATIGTVTLLSKELGEMIVPYLLIVSIALTFSLLVGTVFGTYPALRAALMDPIEALRS